MKDNGSEIYKALFRGPDLLVMYGYSGTHKAELWFRIQPFELQITKKPPTFFIKVDKNGFEQLFQQFIL
jgi:hypothetical protein